MEQKQEPKLLAAGNKGAAGQWAGAVIVVLVLVGLGYFIIQNKAQAPAAATSDEEVELADETRAEALHSFEWTFAIVGGNPKTGADKTKVVLTYDGQARDVGTYEGHCSVLGGEGASGWPLAENELTAVICYWAGAGDEVGVFLENGAYVVKHGTLEEGTSEEPGTRGDYKELFRI